MRPSFVLTKFVSLEIGMITIIAGSRLCAT